MKGRPVLYFSAIDLLGSEAVTVARAEGKIDSLLAGWAEMSLHKPVTIGSLEVGQVVEYTVSEEAAEVGLVIEWSNQLAEVGTRIGVN